MVGEVQPVKDGTNGAPSQDPDYFNVGDNNPDVGWVSPDVAAAEAGQQVEMGKELVDMTHRTEDLRED